MMSVNVTPDEWEMVSAYLDDQLPAAEKLIIEQQLGLRPELQSAYHELRRLKFAFKSLPPKKAPRNYTLSPKEKKEKTSIFQMLVPAFGFSSAVAAILLAITIFFQITPSGSMVSQAPEPAMMAAEQESGQSKTAPGTQPQIITWGSPGGVGFGGGGSGPAYGIGGGAPAAAVEQQTMDDAAKIAGSQDLTAKSLPTGEPTIIEKQVPEQDVPPLPVEQNDLISGIRPAEQRGKILSTPPGQPTISPESSDASGRLNFSALQILLVILTIVFGLSAFFLHRKGKM